MNHEEIIKALDWHDNLVVHSQAYKEFYEIEIMRARGTEFLKNINIVVCETPNSIERLRQLRFRLLADELTRNMWSGFMLAEFCAIAERKNKGTYR